MRSRRSVGCCLVWAASALTFGCVSGAAGDASRPVPIERCADVTYELRTAGSTRYMLVPPAPAERAAGARDVIQVSTRRPLPLEVTDYSPTGEVLGTARSGPAPTLIVMDGRASYDAPRLLEIRHTGDQPLLRTEPVTLRVCDRPAFLDEEIEPNHRSADATAIDVDGRVAGYFGADDDVELLRLPPLDGIDVELRVEGPLGVDVYLDLLDHGGELIRRVDRSRRGRGEHVRFDVSERANVRFVRLGALDREGGTRMWSAELRAIESPRTRPTRRPSSSRSDERDEEEGADSDPDPNDVTP